MISVYRHWPLVNNSHFSLEVEASPVAADASRRRISTDVDADDLGDADSVFPCDVSVISILRVGNCVHFIKLCRPIHYVHVIDCIILLHYTGITIN